MCFTVIGEMDMKDEDEKETVRVEKHIYHKGDSALTTILKGIGWVITLPFRMVGGFFKWVVIILLVLIVGYFAWTAYVVHESAKTDSGYTESVKLLNNIIEASKEADNTVNNK